MTFFLKNYESLIEAMKASDIFSFSSGLKHNKSKSEFSEIGILEGGQFETVV